jgi:hypothetical protein
MPGDKCRTHLEIPAPFDYLYALLPPKSVACVKEAPHKLRRMAADVLTIDRLERWVSFGAQWRVVDIGVGHAVVDFCTCGGMPVERLETSDSAVIDYLRIDHSELDLDLG